jgi:hypothetical protein
MSIEGVTNPVTGFRELLIQLGRLNGAGGAEGAGGFEGSGCGSSKPALAEVTGSVTTNKTASRIDRVFLSRSDFCFTGMHIPVFSVIQLLCCNNLTFLSL